MKKSTYEEIGRSGSPEQMQDAINRLSKFNSYTMTLSRLDFLIKGVVEGFNEGGTENLQSLLRSKSLLNEFYRLNSAFILDRISEKSGNKPDIINRALENVSEIEKKEILSQALYESMYYGMGDEKFVDALLQAGADPNAKTYGKKSGAILAQAAVENRDLPVFQALYDHGASFDKARMYMNSEHYDVRYIETLKFFQEQIEKKLVAAAIQPEAEPAAQPVSEEAVLQILQTVQEMQEQIRELTEKVDRLSPPVQEQTAAKKPTAYPSGASGNPKKANPAAPLR